MCRSISVDTCFISIVLHSSIGSLIFMHNIVTELDPNHTFIIGYISHYHVSSIMFYEIFLNFVWTSKLKLSKASKKYSRNTFASYKIPLNTPRNTPNYMCDLDP